MEIKVTPYKPIDEMWRDVLDFARTTVGKDELKTYPSEKFKNDVLNSEHSPIRAIIFKVVIKDIKNFVTQQFSRHRIGLAEMEYYFTEQYTPTDIEHFVQTSRSDRTGINRDDRKQSDLVDYSFLINAQGLIDLSKKRLCHAADRDAVKTWAIIKMQVQEIDPIIASYMVKSCIYLDRCKEPDFVKCEQKKFFELK